MNGPTARIDGLLPPGGSQPAPVHVNADEVWSVGRRDNRFLRDHPDRARWHLGVPDASADLSVNHLELRVGSVGLAVSGRRGAGVLVDGSVRPGPVVLTAGTCVVSPSVSGTGVGFRVTVLAGETFAARDDALAASGTTIALRMTLEPGTGLHRVATALAWPVMPTRRRAHVLGWSGRDVAGRMAQLGWSLGDPGTEITVLGKMLLTLADKVANCRLADGRRADIVFPHWPPWIDEAGSETRDQRAERRNQCVADVLWRAGAVDVDVIDC
ncbi:hypothetical protein [Pseudonocardia broussonetiae]|uniref:Uncharacterized protein n=1 Tax=Pseudonocardia broussonetiae TaxID=2736640 RepID=A0A6M6JMU7_9PSEU|nr:hypothetical protein [Pseudonocardia broussonetiae]QJY47942.1 hypothetical protein HOP40_20840 [Pseudonocardia broussonetiae]